ncbi:MAG: aminotransferase class I/II-fold pyridoxal phosphate-dependent enzyme [Ekhidna sp.]|uniref:pyridoxal phosphate-dependent decarboxylase family protein n=1 Tax=Ekhidna sp. TaxID=2608089 RepID=UPI0032ECAC0A
MKLEKESIALLAKALEKLESGFDLPDLNHSFDSKRMEEVILKVAERMQDNYPYFHPLFAGQMLKPPHPIAKAAYMLAMWINPNNHAMDGSKASSPMEKAVVADLAKMFGWDTHLGHLTGGGTMANLEALWVAGQIHTNKIIVASDQAHYTHERISEVLKLPFTKVKTDSQGIMDLEDLESILKKGGVGTVVCTMGTTGLGSVDPLPELLELKKKYDFRIHVDAAYGGYFKLLKNLEESALRKYAMIDQADSIVIDPHKQGLQPYGCGCVLFKNPEVAQYYIHDSPYTYFISDELHLGEISLECSRAGASAVALWATHQLLPPVQNGEFSKDLSKSRDAALDLYHRLIKSESFYPIVKPETDIVAWAIAGSKTSEMSEQAKGFFVRAEKNKLYLSLYKYPTSKLIDPPFEVDSEYLVCLRSSLMKPEHQNWMDEIWNRLLKSIS